MRKMWTMFRIETVLCTFSVLYVAAKADFKAGNCSEVREACVAKGFSFAHVPLTEISGTVNSTEKVAICATMLFKSYVGNVSRFWIQKVDVTSVDCSVVPFGHLMSPKDANRSALVKVAWSLRAVRPSEDLLCIY